MGPPSIKLQSFLANLPLFREMNPEEIDRLAEGTREIYAERGEILFHKGDPCVGFHVVVYGQVKLAFTSPHGAEKVVDIIGRGESFGEALMFVGSPYIVYAQTLADSMLVHVSKETVFAELDRDPRFARKMIAGLSSRLHSLLRDVEAYSMASGAQRVIGYLLRDEQEVALAGTTGLTVTLPVTKGVLASRLNLTPEHFSRILHDLSNTGLISVEGRNVHIPNIERLRAVKV
ncbi:MAG: Crp/Fnr family transcriptional regulator [Burkholderiales bacterium]